MNRYQSISQALFESKYQLIMEGQVHRTPKWQGIDAPAPLLEILHWSFTCPIPHSVSEMQKQSGCNLPWADLHFEERVGGKPLNPGEQYKNWPFYRHNVPQHQTEQGDKFTHTYMERMWCNHFSELDPSNSGYDGIRYPYGDLSDVVELLKREPDTRQAYLPIWFPEDTGATHGGRVPCTLGYHFMIRDGVMHCMYPIRSCDIVRHLPDDIYLACRLTRWLCERVDPSLRCGDLTMVFGSLHCWDVERDMLSRTLGI